jgi:hypothetical protein
MIVITGILFIILTKPKRISVWSRM